jgi:hypothetical protein
MRRDQMACCVVAGGAVLACRDYERWRALGPGGAPFNPAGWLFVTALRAAKREGTGTDLFGPLLGTLGDGRWLADLAPRAGTRPRIDPHPIPQRQVDQPGDIRARAIVAERFDELERRSTALEYRPSRLEGHTEAITVGAPSDLIVDLGTYGEAAHIHSGDGSMHMVFSPSDAVAVLEAGWGERHSLAGRFGRLPLTYVMVYAPRSAAEAELIGKLLAASVGYMLQAEPLAAV